MSTVKTVFWTVVIIIVLAVGGFAWFGWSGAYGIGADNPHWPVTYATIKWFRNHAVHAHAAAVQVPADLESPARIREGAEHYNEMCTGCHLKPGKSGDEMRKGLYPKPPDFSQMSKPKNPKVAFWVIKHGIKFTAMPAWGKTHSDDKIWAIVAFVRKLPGMTPQQYAAYTAGAKHEEGDEHASPAPSAPAGAASAPTHMAPPAATSTAPGSVSTATGAAP